MNHPTTTDWRNRAEAAEQRCAELADDVRIWVGEAEDRSQGMIDLNLDRAAMGVENLKLRDENAALRSHVDALAGALERGLDWFRHATADDDCDWLNEHGWPLSESRMKESAAALANYTAWLIDGGAK